jgi:hypothetical protein
MKSKKDLVVGIIGLSMGRAHLRAVLNYGAEVGAICDIDPEQLNKVGDVKDGGLLVTYDSPADGELTLTVAEGDEIAFVINRNATTAFDATNTSVSIAYQ